MRSTRLLKFLGVIGRLRLPGSLVQWQPQSFHRALVQVIDVHRGAENRREHVPDLRGCGIRLARHAGEILLQRQPREITQTQTAESRLKYFAMMP